MNKNQKTLSIDEMFELEKDESTINPFEILNDIELTSKKTKRLDKKNIQKIKKENKTYLPVLSLNDPSMWPPKDKKDRIYFTDEVAMETCLSNCCGVPGVFSACCRLDLDDLEHVLGPVKEKWIKRFLKYSKKRGWDYKRSDVVIDFEEGKMIGEKFFDNHQVFNSKNSYPMMRLQIMDNRFACKFLNPSDGLCGIYSQRPDMCKNYICQYVRNNYFVRTKDQPNTYKKITNKDKEEQ